MAGVRRGPVRVTAALVDLNGRLGGSFRLTPVTGRERHVARLEDRVLQPEQVTLAPQERFELIEHRGQRAGVAEVGMSGLESVEACCERVLVGGRPPGRGGALPIVEGMIELQPVGGDY